MDMRRGKVSVFAIGIAVLLTFQQQDAVYGTSSVASSQSSVSVSISPSSTTSANASGAMATTNSSTQTVTATVPTTSVTTSTSGSSSGTTSTTATTSTSNVIIVQSTATPPSKIKKTCAVVKATVEGNKPSPLEDFLEDSLFNDTKKYTDVKFTVLMDEGNKISFKVCLNFNSGGYFKDDAGTLLKGILNVSSVEVEIKGVVLTKWEATDDECKTCSSTGGPFKIKRECSDGEYSCNGVKTTDETEDCDKYCSESGAVYFMVSYLLVAMGIALSLSFYL